MHTSASHYEASDVENVDVAQGSSEMLVNLTTSRCDFLDGVKPADNIFDIGPQQEAVHLSA